jgi:hypothetical protein
MKPVSWSILIVDSADIAAIKAGVVAIAQQLTELQKGETTIMSQITDWAAKEQANLDTISKTLDGIVTGVANLDTMIQNFQNSPGTLSPTDQAALDAIANASSTLVTKAEAISVAPPSATAPTAQSTTS